MNLYLWATVPQALRGQGEREALAKWEGADMTSVRFAFSLVLRPCTVDSDMIHQSANICFAEYGTITYRAIVLADDACKVGNQI